MLQDLNPRGGVTPHGDTQISRVENFPREPTIGHRLFDVYYPGREMYLTSRDPASVTPLGELPFYSWATQVAVVTELTGRRGASLVRPPLLPAPLTGPGHRSPSVW